MECSSVLAMQLGVGGGVMIILVLVFVDAWINEMNLRERGATTKGSFSMQGQKAVDLEFSVDKEHEDLTWENPKVAKKLTVRK